MYYSGQLSNKTKHCVGAATSDDILGPYTPSYSWFACDVSVGGAIDPSGFRDHDGKRYVAYKIDGNSIGHGGSCGNGVKPQVATPILLQEVSATDGVTRIGAPVQILDRSDADGPLVEAPALLRTGAGLYVLFHSSGCYSSPSYDVKYATAKSMRGPYTRAAEPLLSTNAAANLTSPGGATPVANGSAIVFHADCDEGRCFYERSIKISGTNITLA
jgi:beta-xylosidase